MDTFVRRRLYPMRYNNYSLCTMMCNIWFEEMCICAQSACTWNRCHTNIHEHTFRCVCVVADLSIIIAAVGFTFVAFAVWDHHHHHPVHSDRINTTYAYPIYEEWTDVDSLEWKSLPTTIANGIMTTMHKRCVSIGRTLGLVEKRVKKHYNSRCVQICSSQMECVIHYVQCNC